MQININDPFMNPNRFGYAVVPFKLDGNREPPEHVPQWRIRRSNARSMGCASFTHTKPCKACGSLEKRVYDLKCMPCFKIGKKK